MEIKNSRITLNEKDLEELAGIMRGMLIQYVSGLSDYEVASAGMANYFVPPWKSGFVKKGERRTDAGKIFVALESAMSEVRPSEDSNLWKELIKSEEEYPPYDSTKAYYKGDKITFTDGKKYLCIYENGVVNWGPDDFPEGWRLVDYGEEELA